MQLVFIPFLCIHIFLLKIEGCAPEACHVLKGSKSLCSCYITRVCKGYLFRRITYAIKKKERDI